MAGLPLAPEGKLMKVSVSGGAAVTIAGMAEARGASWGADESIVVNPEFLGGSLTSLGKWW